MMHGSREFDYDVIVIGGSLSGAALATLVLKETPSLRVLVIEKSEKFTRRVGEATVEVSAYFLGRVLGLTQHLNESHLVKQGMRFWFHNAETKSLDQASEIGGKFQARLPSYQLDRAVFDEEVLRRAVELGAELRRPAQVTAVDLQTGSARVTVKAGDQVQTLHARWVVDASGVAALLARKNGWLKMNEQHPTAAAWARWQGVKDWDGPEFATRFPDWFARCYGVRGTATNHIVGDGWWSWWIPLKGGDVSVGVVFDQRLNEFPGEGQPIAERLRQFLQQHPVARELLEHAQPVEGDALWRRNLAYSSTTFAGDGFSLVGDASAFIDPFYSPGMDWISFTTTATAALIAAQQRGEAVAPLVARHNAQFSQAYSRWFQAIYRDKYEYMGDYELMSAAFRLDLGLYYLGIVSQPFKFGPKALQTPPFVPAVSTPIFHFIRNYNRRLASMARNRRRRGVHGIANSGRNLLVPGYTFGGANAWLLAKAIGAWLRLEIKEGWRTWFTSEKTAPASSAASMPAKNAVPAA
ncbi:MAG: NAD(P)/FAD-dependent oxidoreductase [Chthoniobacteraceae bacterium]